MSNCEHKWETLEAFNIIKKFDAGVIGFFLDSYEEKIGTEYHLRCEKCGEIKITKS